MKFLKKFFKIKILVDEIDPFIREFKNKNVNLRYLFEYEPLSTAGGSGFEISAIKLYLSGITMIS